MVDASFRIDERAALSPSAAQARGSRRLHVLLFMLFVAGAVALTLRGYDFYLLSIGERVDHPDFRVLGPGSNLGHGYGIAGTALILTNLTYLLRRRFARLSMGSLRAWLDVHVFTGLFGGMLVLFHSAFQVRSSIALITVGSLLIVIVTGLLGRYLYALAPKADGARLEALLSALDVVGPGMGQVLASRVRLVPRTPSPERLSLLAVIGRLPRYRLEARQRRALIEQVVAHYAAHLPGEVRLLEKPIAQCTRIYMGEVRAAAAGALLKSWRGLHRLAALVMVTLVALHIGVAWYYGFVWVFDE
jgi:hypothetical protein